MRNGSPFRIFFRSGQIPPGIKTRVMEADSGKLEMFRKALFRFESLQDAEKWWSEN